MEKPKTHMIIKIIEDEDIISSDKDKMMQVIKCTGWLMQMGDTTPIMLEEEKQYNIKANSKYKILKGAGNLVVSLI